MLPKHGEIWWSEPADIGRRPVVVLSRDQAIARRRVLIAAPCSTRVRGLPTEVVREPGDDPVRQRCVVNLDSVESLPVGLLIERMGALSDLRMQQICAALEVAVDCAH